MDEPLAAAATPLAAGGDSALEAGSLAREMTGAYLEMLASARERLERAQAGAAGPDILFDDDPERVPETPSDRVSWFALARLAEHDPEQLEAAWERLKAEARDELASGHRAARTLECFSGPWERAQFLAIRQAFVEEWQPRGGIEQTLIDTMAQAQTAYLYWLSRLHLQTLVDTSVPDTRLKRPSSWEPPRLEVAAAMEQSAAMADRFQRMFLRALRALRDLRRYAPQVVVRSAGQVNVGAQQVNVAGDPPG